MDEFTPGLSSTGLGVDAQKVKDLRSKTNNKILFPCIVTFCSDRLAQSKSKITS